MRRTFTWLTVSLLASNAAFAAPEPNQAALIYTLDRELEKMERQIKELRAMVEKLSEQNTCVTAAQPPPPPPLAPPGEMHGAPPIPPEAPPTTRASVSGKVVFDRMEKGLAYVYIADVKEAPIKGKLVEIRQTNMKFRPDHLVVQSGTRISFPNDDKLAHNVFSATPSNAFNLSYVRNGDAPPSQLFVAPGLVDINCNVHPEMQATVLVVPNRYRAQTRDDGSFTLLGVPLGKHTLKAWAPGAEIAQREITVQVDGAPVTIQLTPRKRGLR